MEEASVSNKAFNFTAYFGQSAGSAQSSEGTSFSAFATSLVTYVVLAGVQLAAFLIFRGYGVKWSKRFYAPRTYLVTRSRQVQELPRGLVLWARVFLSHLDDEIVSNKCGLDAFFFLRYLKMLAVVFCAIVIVFPVLIPINITGGGLARGLDRLAFANVANFNNKRLWAQLVIAWLFFLWVLYTISYEMRYYVKKRQIYLTSHQHRMTASATTVLINTIPPNLMDVRKLRRIFSGFPGGVKYVWLNRDFSKLTDLVNERNGIAEQLESAENELIRLAHQEVEKTREKAEKKKGSKHRNMDVKAEALGRNDDSNIHAAAKWKLYLDSEQRPSHRLPLASWIPFALPLIGHKVDTIDWCRLKLSILNPKIEQERLQNSKYKLMNSAFIQFHTQSAAHMAVQTVIHYSIVQLAPREIEVAPQSIIWWNLRIKWWERTLRYLVVVASVTAMIVLWAIPVAFVGLVSQVKYLASTVSWLGWLNNLPGVILGIITGVLPSAAVAGLTALLPVLLRRHTTHVGVELATQDMYFAFLFVQIFLVVSISSGLTTVAQGIINNPSATPGLLAQNLPKASNFFFSYMLLQGLAVSAGGLLQLTRIVSLSIFGFLFDNTPRKKWRRQVHLSNFNWGTFYPTYTNLAVIGLVYTCIAPLIMVFCLIAFILFYFVYRYNFLYVNQFPLDMGGLAYPKALFQLFTGIYVGQACLVGLFFLVRDMNGNAAAVPQAVLMIVLLVCTVVFHFFLHATVTPVRKYLAVISEEQATKSISSGIDGDLDQDDEEDENDRLVDATNPRYDLRSAVKSTVRATLTAPFKIPLKAPVTAPLRSLEKLGIRKGAENGLGNTTGRDLRPRNAYHRESLSHSLSSARVDSAEDVTDVETNTNTLPQGNSTVFSDIPDELEDLDEEEIEALVRRAYNHPSTYNQKPTIWLAEDSLGIAADEIRQTMEFSKEVEVSMEGAFLDKHGRPQFYRSPPDYNPANFIQI